MNDNDIISKLYETVIEELHPSKKYKELLSYLGKAKKDFMSKPENQNAEKLDDLCNIAYELNDEFNKQVFFKGIVLGIKLVNYNAEDNEL